MMINRSSFQVNGAFDKFGAYGTVELTIAGQTKRVRAIWSHSEASPHLDGEIRAYGVTGRYRTGMKAWPGSISQRISPTRGEYENVSFGFDSRSGKHHKATISFAQEVA